VSGTLVVGASQAGLQLAISLREAGDTAPITLVGAEPHAPYQRPPLSKAFLLGTTDATGLSFRTPAFYTERGIELVLGERVEELEIAPGGSAGSAGTDRGRSLAFDRLALTVGARVRKLTVPGAELDGVHHLRDLADAERLRSSLTGARRVVVVGGGFVGLEAAAVARALGKEVTVVEVGDRLVGRAVAAVTSEFYLEAHQRRGVTVRLGSAVVAVVGGPGGVRGVALDDGTELPADLVLVGIGIVPRTELAVRIGLECDPGLGGIVVNRDAATDRAGVVAAGDCTVAPHPVTGEGRVRLESVQNAVSQAKAAAATLAGGPRPAPEVPWFWSDQGDLKLQIAGLSADHDGVVVRGNPATERFSVLYYRDGTLLGVDAVNSPADYLTVRRALATNADIPAERVRASDRPLKELLVPDSVRAGNR
jgi:3-phenylpropionate/trans-cinnamate dioxygenase ferredoxin reductase subunit